MMRFECLISGIAEWIQNESLCRETATMRDPSALKADDQTFRQLLIVFRLLAGDETVVAGEKGTSNGYQHEKIPADACSFIALHYAGCTGDSES